MMRPHVGRTSAPRAAAGHARRAPPPPPPPAPPPALLPRPRLPPAPTLFVVAGVSASGKSTLGRRLARRFGWPFIEGDDFHPPANVAKMSAGTPLNDGDRAPWLAALAAQVVEPRCAARAPAVLACSALAPAHRRALAGAAPPAAVAFILLAPRVAELRARAASRAAAGEHWMPPSLLPSQLEALEYAEGELFLCLRGRAAMPAAALRAATDAVMAAGHPLRPRLAARGAARGAVGGVAAGDDDESSDEEEGEEVEDVEDVAAEDCAPEAVA
jgi:gluconokinase